MFTHLLPLDILGKRCSSPIFLLQGLVLGQMFNQRNNLFHRQQIPNLRITLLYIFISHRNLNRLSHFLDRITQIILEMTLLALVSPLLVGFSLQCHVM